MALTLHKSPAAVNFSNDPVVLGFTTDALIVSSGTQAVSLIEFSTSLSEGDILLLRWAGNEIRFEAKNAPVLSNELPTGTTTLSTLLPYFAQNHTLQEDFDIVIDTGKLKFTAKNAGLNNLAPLTFAGGTVTTSIEGVSAQIRENFAVWLEVKVASEIIYEDLIPVNSLGIAEVDISEALTATLKPDMPLEMSNVAKCTKSVKDFSIRYAEVFGSKPQIQRVTVGSTYKVMLGGSSRKNPLAPVNLLGGTALSDPCLRYGSPLRYTGIDDNQFLYFSALRSANTYHAKISVTYTDDTTHSFDTGTVVLALYEKAFFNVGFEALDLGSLPKDVKSYTVTIFNPTLAASKAYTYIIDYGYHRFKRHFAFINSLGAVDHFTAYGKQSREMQYFKEQAERVIDESTSDLQQFLDYKIELQETFEVATGFKSKNEIAYLRDFYLSSEKWKVDSQWYPIIVNTTKVKEAKDGDNLYAHSFEYVYAYRDDGFSESDLDDDIMPSPPPGFLGGGSVSVTINQEGVDFDPVPVQSSTKAVRSGGLFSSLAQKENLLPSGSQTQFFRGDKTLGTLSQEVVAVSDPRYFYNNTFGHTNKNLYTAVVDATNSATTDPSASTPGQLDIGTVFAELINLGNSAAEIAVAGNVSFASGVLDLKEQSYNGIKVKNNSGTLIRSFEYLDSGLAYSSETVKPFRLDLSNFDQEIAHILNVPDFLPELAEVSAGQVIRNLATQEWVEALGSPWYLGGNGLINGDQKIGFGGVTYTAGGAIDQTFIGNLLIELFGSTVAKFTPEGNAIFGHSTPDPLAVGHFHANVTGDTEVALFRASNVSVNNYFGVSVDPTLNQVNLRNSGTLHVKNSWVFDTSVNFGLSPVVPTATVGNQAVNLAQVQSMVSAGFSPKTPVKLVFTTNQTLTGAKTQGGYTTVTNDRALFTAQTTGTQNGIYTYNGTSWVRPSTDDEDTELRGKGYLCLEGTYKNTNWVNSNASEIIINTTTPTYIQWTGAETDPIFTAHAAYGINATLISNWNSAYTSSVANTSSINSINTALSNKSDVGHTHDFSVISNKPTTLSGYGISAGLNTNYLTKWSGNTIVDSSVSESGGVLNVPLKISQASAPNKITYFGTNAGYNQSTSSGANNSGFGYGALQNIVSSGNNTAIGAYALNTAASNYSSYNTAVGAYALYQIASSSANSSNYNTAIGLSAGSNRASMKYSTLIGAGANVQSNADENVIAIGFNTIGKGSNTGTWGNSSITDHYFTGNVHFTGLLKPDSVTPTAHQFYKVNSAADSVEAVTLLNTHISNWDAAWSANMTSFIGAAPSALDTWLELVAEIQSQDSDISGLLTATAANTSGINAINTKLGTLANKYLTKWDGTKFVNSRFSEESFHNVIERRIDQVISGDNTYFGVDSGVNSSGTFAGNTAFGFHAAKGVTTGKYITALGYKSATGLVSAQAVTSVGYESLKSAVGAYVSSAVAVGYRTLQNVGATNASGGFVAIGNDIGSGITRTLYSTLVGHMITPTNDATNEIAIGWAASGHGSNTGTWGNSSITDHYFTGNVHFTGLLKPDSVTPTAHQFYKVNSAADSVEAVTLNESLLIQTLELTSGHFVRELQGLHMANDGSEAFFVGTDVETGSGLFRHKYYDQYMSASIREHSFDPEDNHRLFVYNPSAENSRRDYMFKDEFQSWLDNQYVPGGSGSGSATVPTLQQVLDKNRNATKRAQFNNVDYATVDEVAQAQSIDAVLGNGATTNDKWLTFNTTLNDNISGGVKWAVDGATKVQAFLVDNTSGFDAFNIQVDGQTHFNLNSAKDLTLFAGDFAETANHLFTKVILNEVGLEIANGKPLIMKDTVTSTKYKVTIANGAFAFAAI